MNKWIKYGLYGVAALAVVGLVAQSKLKALDLDTAVVNHQNVQATVVEKGKVVSSETQDIFSEIQGKVLATYVETGEAVSKDKLLAVLDTSDFDSKIAQLEGELKTVLGTEESAKTRSGSNQIKQQQLALEQAWVALDLAKISYQRTQKLFYEGGVTKAELDMAKAEMDTKQTAVAQAEEALTASRNLGKGDKLTYQGQRESIQAQINYLKTQKTKAQIVSAQGGTVYARKVKTGDIVSPGMLLFTIGASGSGDLTIETYVNSKDIANVKLGNVVNVLFKMPGQDVETKGEISKISPVTEERTSALGIIEDKIKVTIKLKKLPENVKMIPGMTVDVTLITQEANNVLAVPKEAVFADKGQDFVWVVKNGVATLSQVEKGIEGDSLVEIKKGVGNGERVIMNPHLPELREGVKVK